MPKQSSGILFAEKVAQPVADAMGIELVDVELAKEAAGRFLRFTVDKPGGISIDDCEAFHKAVIPLVENVDYDYMEVSSPGVDRPLKNQKDFEKALGKKVEVHLYKPQQGAKILTGILEDATQDTLTIRDAGGGLLTFEKKKTALVRLVFEFDESVLDLSDEDEDALNEDDESNADMLEEDEFSGMEDVSIGQEEEGNVSERE